MLNLRLPEQLDRQLAEEARSSQRSRSEVAREALSFYLRVQGRRRYIERLERAASRLAAAESRALADEALAFDNEAFAIPEAAPSYADGDEKWWR